MYIMNYSFLEPLTEFAFRTVAAPSVAPIPVDLDDSWTEFEKELGKYKMQYAKARANANILVSQLTSKQSDLNILEVASKVLKSSGLKANLAEVIGNYEVAEGVSDLTRDYAEALGRVGAMKSILMDTNAERYARFTCFVCMDSLVDSLLDPCNHAICEHCWHRARSSNCPGCRTEVREVRKIFTLS